MITQVPFNFCVCETIANYETKVTDFENEIERLKKIEATANEHAENVSSMRTEVAKSRSELATKTQEFQSIIENLKEEIDSFKLGGGSQPSSVSSNKISEEELEKYKVEITQHVEEIDELQSALEESKEETQSAIEQGKLYRQKLKGMMESREADLIKRIMSYAYFQVTYTHPLVSNRKKNVENKKKSDLCLLSKDYFFLENKNYKTNNYALNTLQSIKNEVDILSLPRNSFQKNSAANFKSHQFLFIFVFLS